MSNPFVFVNAINAHDPSVMTPETEGEYSAFLTNRALSYHVECIFYANEMNRYADLDARMQFAYYLNTLPKKKRFSKWHKKEDDETVSAISQYFQCSLSKAREMKDVLSVNDKQSILQRLSKGGVNNEKRRTAR